MSTDAGAEFWEFSTRRYAEPGVAPAALRLQDEFGCDVNLLLFCLWTGARGCGLKVADLEALDAAALPWRSTIVEPLRRVRRALKAPPFAGARADPIRRRLLDVEIDCERLTQEAIAAALPLMPGTGGTALARGNVETYLRWRGVDLDLAEPLVTALMPG